MNRIWIALRLPILAAVLMIGASLPQASAFQPLPNPHDFVVPASQSVDSCYRRCVMNRAWGSRTKQCMFACNRLPSRKCEDRCYRQEPNRPLHRDACIARCLRR
jgi:hypothetical protein